MFTKLTKAFTGDRLSRRIPAITYAGLAMHETIGKSWTIGHYDYSRGYHIHILHHFGTYCRRIGHLQVFHAKDPPPERKSVRGGIYERGGLLTWKIRSSGNVSFTSLRIA